MSRRPRLHLETLEEREVPSAAPLELTSYMDSLGAAVTSEIRTTLADIHDAHAGLVSDFRAADAAITTAKQSPVLSFASPDTILTGASGAQISVADFEPFRTKGFVFETDIRASAMQMGTIVSKYDSSLSTPDASLNVRMTAEGKILFYVYQDGNGNVMRGVQTVSSVVHVGEWQTIGTIFNAATGEMGITINGQRVPVEEVVAGNVRYLNDGLSPVRLGTIRGGGGTNVLNFAGELRDAAFKSSDVGNLSALETQRSALFDQLVAMELADDATDAAAPLVVDVREETTPIIVDDVAESSSKPEPTADALREVIALLEGSMLSLTTSGSVAGSGAVASIASSRFTPYLSEGFQIDMDVRLSSLTGRGVLVTKYDSTLSTPDCALYVGTEGGTIVFYVYQDGAGTVMRGGVTQDAVLGVDMLQHVRVIFDPATQRMAVTVDRQDVPLILSYTGVVSSLNSGPASLNVGAYVPASGVKSQVCQGTITNVTVGRVGAIDDLTALRTQLAEVENGAEAVTEIASPQQALPSIDTSAETHTRTELGRALLEKASMEKQIAGLLYQRQVREGDIQSAKAEIAIQEAEIAPYVNDPANATFVQGREQYMDIYRQRITRNERELRTIDGDLRSLQEACVTGDERIADLTQHLGTLTSSMEAQTFASWVDARLDEGRGMFSAEGFAWWSGRFEGTGFTEAPPLYQWQELADATVVTGFAENALQFSGLARWDAAWACLQAKRPDLFGANWEESRQLAVIKSGAAGGHEYDAVIEGQIRIAHATGLAVNRMNESLGNVVSAVFREQLRKHLGLPVQNPIGDYASLIAWDRNLLDASCVPTSAQILDAVNAHFDAIYSAFDRMGTQQAQAYRAQLNLSTYGYDRSAEMASFLQSAQEVLGSTGEGTLEERFARYASAFPELADMVREHITAGQLVVDVRTEAYFTALNTGTMVVSGEVLGALLVEGAEGDVIDVGGAEPESPGFWAGMRSATAAESSAIHYSVLDHYALQSEGQLTVAWGDQRIRIDTKSGRILAGIAPMLRSYQAAPWSLARLSTRVEQVFGVDAVQLYYLSKTDDDGRLYEGLISLFGQKGYDMVTTPVEGQLPLRIEHVGGVLRVHANPSGFHDVHHFQANIVNIGDGTNVVENVVPVSQGRFFMDIPLSTFVGRENVGVKIVAWGEQGQVLSWNTTETIIVSAEDIPPEAGSWTTKNLSTLQLTDAFHDQELQILQRLHFPLEKDGVHWTNGVSSTLHDGAALYALDLNANGDFGKTVFAPASGTIHSANLTTGTIVMQHTLADGTIWTTTFHHLTDILEGQTGIEYEGVKEAADRLKLQYAEGSEEYLAGVAAADAERAEAQIAVDVYIRSHTMDAMLAVAAVGNEGASTGSHSHMQVNIGEHAVNLFHWLNEQQPGIVTTGDVSGRSNYSVQWSEAVGELVHAPERIVVERVEKNGEVMNLAYAWVDGQTIEQMERVVWIHQLEDGRTVDAWLSIDLTRKWNSQIQTWESL